MFFIILGVGDVRRYSIFVFREFMVLIVSSVLKGRNNIWFIFMIYSRI